MICLSLIVIVILAKKMVDLIKRSTAIHKTRMGV